jgi:hypothetical protein
MKAYSGDPLTIPPLNTGQIAYIDLADPPIARVEETPQEVDLDLNGGNGWDSRNPLAELGTSTPSYSACMAVLNNHPMNLSTQTFQQGHGYCTQLTSDNEPDDVVYIKFTELMSDDTGNGGSGQVIIQVTRWNNTTSGQ